MKLPVPIWLMRWLAPGFVRHIEIHGHAKRSKTFFGRFEIGISGKRLDG